MTPSPSARVVERDLVAWEKHLGSPVDAAKLPSSLTAGSLPAAFAATAAHRGDAPALTIDGESRTHAELDAEGSALAWALAKLGLDPTATVAISAPSSIDLVVAYLGCLKLGITVLLPSPKLTGWEMSQILSHSGADAAIFSEDVAITPQHTGATQVLGLGELAEQATVDPPPAQLDAIRSRVVALSGSRTAFLAYTSGTTGAPKGVPLTHANLLASIRAAMRAWRWAETDSITHALPLSHQHGLGTVHATLLAGSRAVLHSRFDPSALAESVEGERATVLFGVPTNYRRLVDAGVSRGRFRSLRLAVTGSAPMSPSLYGEVERLIGRPPLERYGTTESGLNVANPYHGSRQPGAVGLSLPGVEVDLLGASEESGEAEIVVRGPQVFGGYLDDGEATNQALVAGGWFRTGDLGHFDPNTGYLVITGRVKELILTGGVNVAPVEVEQALESHPGVSEVTVAGIPSEQWGEEVVAFVVPGKEAPSHRELDDHLRARLAAFKRPKRYVFVDELPRNSVGKVQRHLLAEPAPGRQVGDGLDD